MGIKSIISILVFFVSFSSLSQQMNRMVLEDWSNGEWENSLQLLPFYDDEGRLLKKETAHWNADLKVWENRTKMVFNRDENGCLLNRETFNWSQDQSTWEATHRVSYSINTKKMPSTVLFEERNEQGWYNKSIDENTYDDHGNLIQKRRERWNNQLMAWVPERKYDYAIESNRKAGYTIFFWDSKLEDWKEYQKAVFHFSEDEKVESISYSSWENGSWKESSIRRNFLDEEGVLNMREVDKFDLASESWLKASLVEYEHTDFNKVSESVHKKWNGELSKWENLQRSTFSYSKEGKMIQEWSQEQKVMELFPNPAMESLTIRSIPVGTLTIHDALGKLVLYVDNKNETMQLDVSEWETGVYSVQVDGNEVQKFVKQ